MKWQKSRMVWGWLIIIILLLLVMPAAAKNKAKDKAKDKETERVKITGIKKAWGNTDKKQAFLEGDLLIIHEETRIKTTYAELNQDTKEGTFSKGVFTDYKDIKVESSELYINFKKKNGVFSGVVRVKRQKSKDKNGKEKEPFTLLCDRLEMDMDKETFIATGQTVVLEHEDFTGRCQRLDYDNQGEIMEMVGDPVLTRKEGDTVKGDRIRLNLKDETFEILDNAEMAFEVEEEDDADDGGK